MGVVGSVCGGFITGCGELVKKSKMEEANLEEVTNQWLICGFWWRCKCVDFMGSDGGANGRRVL